MQHLEVSGAVRHTHTHTHTHTHIYIYIYVYVIRRLKVKQKSSYQHGSKSEQVPRYSLLCRNPRNAVINKKHATMVMHSVRKCMQ